jgi:heme exporter protein C
MFNKYLKPSSILPLLNAIFPFALGGMIISLFIGLYTAFLTSPSDYQQGDAVRIMYIHVPSAWMSLFIYSVMFFSSISSLIWKNQLSDIIAAESAPIGACFALITLVTGSLWGKPIWGTWWVWDARLTSMLILFFLYLGYIALINSFSDPTLASKPAAILAIIGFINIPIIKFSVDFWNTLHQPASIFRANGPSIHKSMLLPLAFMAIFCMLYFITILIIRIKSVILARKLLRVNL